MLFSDAEKKFWEKCQRHQSVIHLLWRKRKCFRDLKPPTLKSFLRQFVLPFDGILQKPLHFWKRRDNSNVQSFQSVFTIWIPPEKEKEIERDLDVYEI